MIPHPKPWLSSRQADRLARLSLVAFIGLGSFLRLRQIGREGLWLDEAFSVWVSAQPLSDMFGWLVKIDQHPPLYYTLLHLWLTFGDSATIVRALSACFGIITIPIIYWLGTRLGGRTLGLLAAFLLTISPFHVRFAQETRMYTLLTLNTSLAILALVYLLTDSRAATVPIGQQFSQFFRNSRAGDNTATRLSSVATDLAWAGYIIFTLATTLTQNTAIFFPIAVNIFVLSLSNPRRYFEPQPGDFQPPSPKNWLLAQIGLALLWSPWLVGFIFQSIGVDREFWISSPHLGDVFWTLKNFVSPLLPDRVALGNLVWVLYGLMALLGLVYFRKNPGRAGLLLILFLTPIIGELLVSLRRPIFYDRTLIWATIPLYLLLAAGICWLRYRPFILAATLMLAAVNTISLNEYYTVFRKEEWDDAARYVAEQAQADDLILFNATWVQIPFDFYFRYYQRPIAEHGVPVDLFDRGILEPKMSQEDLPRLYSLINDRQRVWLIYSHDWYTDPQGIITTALNEKLIPLSRQEFVGLNVYLYGAPQ